jgi:cytochrome c peroxidase
LLGILALLQPAWLNAASPGVPVLPNTPNNYVGYAVTNLPAQFRTGAINAADNTPVNNPISNLGAELGRVLFYDQRLSHNNGTSCASCHKQENGFSDPAAKSTGFNGEQTGRHSMGLSNAKFYAPGSFFWDQRAATLEYQVLEPIQSPVEMGMTLRRASQPVAKRVPTARRAESPSYGEGPTG